MVRRQDREPFTRITPDRVTQSIRKPTAARIQVYTVPFTARLSPRPEHTHTDVRARIANDKVAPELLWFLLPGIRILALAHLTPHTSQSLRATAEHSYIPNPIYDNTNCALIRD